MDDVDDEPPGLARVEFSEAEERSLGRLASALGLFGMLQIVISGIGLVLLLIGVASKLGRMPPALLVMAVLGILFVALPIWQGMLVREAGEAIGRVASSDEDDQEYLASAFRRLRAVFVIELGLSLWQLYQGNT